jgi:hypothetical protein
MKIHLCSSYLSVPNYFPCHNPAMLASWASTPAYFLVFAFLCGVAGFRVGWRIGNRVALPLAQSALGWVAFLLAFKTVGPAWASASVGMWILGTTAASVYVFAGHPMETDERVIRAIQDQLAVLPYANPFMATEPRARLGAKLAEITPGDIDVFFFTNGGAEANENAIKIARFFTGRHKIIARYRSYHGSTTASIAATGDPRRWAMEPAGKAQGFIFAPEVNCYDCPIKHTYPSYGVACADYVEHMIANESDVAAIVVEPVTGTNGVLIPPAEYFQEKGPALITRREGEKKRLSRGLFLLSTCAVLPR